MLRRRGSLVGFLLPVLIAAANVPISPAGAAQSRPGGTGPAPVTEHVTDLGDVPPPGIAVSTVSDVRTGVDTELVGFDWRGNGNGALRLRVLTPAGWSPWQKLSSDGADGPDAGAPQVHGRNSAGPVWVGHGVQRVQFQVISGRLPGLRLHAIHSAPATSSSATGAIAPVRAGAAVPQPGIIS